MSKETLFGLSLLPYLAFLWFATKSKQFPKLGLWGFYGTLVFVTERKEKDKQKKERKNEQV